MCFKCKLCRRTLDSTLHCDGPDREIYCRGISFRLTNLYTYTFQFSPLIVLWFSAQISILTIFVSSDTLNKHYIFQMYLCIYHYLYIFFFLFITVCFHSDVDFCCRLLKPQFIWTSTASPTNSPRTRKGCKLLKRKNRVIVNHSVISFEQCYPFIRANICLSILFREFVSIHYKYTRKVYKY